MFRQSLRRCARPASSTLVRPRTAIPSVTRHIALSSTRISAPLKALPYTTRWYSSEAAEAAEAAEPTQPQESGPVSRFGDLASLGVHPNLLDAIVYDMKYETMTPVQAKTINPALKGTDIVAQAKTGTGKTLAFLLPLLNRMISEDKTLATRGASHRARSDDIRGIVLSPTRELAEQIAVEARRLTRNTGLVVQCAVGGTNKTQMLRQTQRQGCHILVATPGRLNDLLNDPQSGIDAPKLAALVLDEADRMLDVGFEKELNEIIRLLPPPDVKARQTMLVSATIPDDVIRLARTMVRPDDFEFVQTIDENDSLTHDKVPQNVVPISSWSNVFPSLFELIDREAAKAAEDPNARPFKGIVYFNTTSLVDVAGEVCFNRKREGLTNLPAYSISSKLSQTQRQRAADMFRQIKSGILVSSDVTARGMDFPNVTHVIQVDTPRSREDYIHRLGRTGRQDKEGEGWLLLTPDAVSSARKMLSGLPLKQNKTLSNAETDISTETSQLPPFHQQFRDLITRIPRSMMVACYTSLFGVSTRKDELAEDLHQWTTRGWGWEAPPVVSPKWAQMMGINPANLNIGTRYEEDKESRGDRYGNRGGDRGGDRYGNRSGGDAFDKMRENVRSDRPERSYGGRGGDRYGGGGNNWGGRGRGGFNRGGGGRDRRDGGRDRGSSW